MAQELILTQEQRLAQQQRLSQQQLLVVRLTEMPLVELEQNIQAELNDNPALEFAPGDMTDGFSTDTSDSSNDTMDDFEREERQDQLDAALERLGGDDELPQPTGYGGNGQTEAEYEERTYGNQLSFYDTLKEQMDMLTLTPTQHDVMEYLIGSLEDNGLLEKSIDTICDELAVYQNIYTTEDEIREVLHQLQQFDPPGIGAQSLQECLLIQIERLPESEHKEMAHKIISKHYNEFMNKRLERIAEAEQQPMESILGGRDIILKLNPKPGAALGESEGRNLMQITPDFIVEVTDDGKVSFSISNGHVPELHVSDDYLNMMDEYQRNRESLTRQQKEALLYYSEKVERARGYIEAVKQRHRTLYSTMKAIIDLQRKYFEEGDENDLQPMVLKDVAERTGLDISTISRVCNSKYAQTPWGTFPLRHFFNEGVQTADGVQTSTRELKAVMKDIIDHEDKKHPLNDDKLAAEMKKRGFPIARRTASKYREQLGYPTARLRKE